MPRGILRSQPREPLYVITDFARLGQDRVLDALGGARKSGLRWVLLREPHAALAETIAFLDALEAIFPREEISLAARPGPQLEERVELVGERRLAGLHVGGGDLDLLARARGRLGAESLLGYSAHSADEARRAFAAGASHVSLSPIFSPRSKRLGASSVVSSAPANALPSIPPAPLGVEWLRSACAEVPGPVFALGGVDAANARELARAGAAGIAVIGAVLDAEDPAASTKALLDAFARA